VFLANLPGIVGYILLLTVRSNGVKYFATFLCAVSVYNGPGLNLTWLNVNVAPHYRRATSIGFQQSMGNTAGIVAGQIYRKSPFKLGVSFFPCIQLSFLMSAVLILTQHGFSLGALCVGEVIILVKMWYIKSCNSKKQNIESGEVADDRKDKTGDHALDFKYHG